MIWILSKASKRYDNQTFRSKSVKLIIIEPEKLQILNNDGNIAFFYEGNIISKPTKVLNWQGCNGGNLEKQIEAALAENVFVNPSNETELFQDKFRFGLETKLPTINSLKIHSSQLVNSIQLIEANYKYPFILKSDTGSLGQGTYLVDSNHQLKTICEMIEMLDKSFKVHIEEYIDYDHDIRMYIIGEEYFLMERKSDIDFRANFSISGGSINKCEDSEMFKQIFKQVRSEYSSLVLGVDILINNNVWYICEINSAPGLKGIESLYGNIVSENIVRKLIEY